MLTPPIDPQEPASARVTPRRSPHLALTIVLVAAGVAVGVWLLISQGQGAKATADFGQIATVTRGPLVYTTTESGEVEAEGRTVIGNELRYDAIIKSVVPEGTSVKKGDEIIEFECKQLIDDIEKDRITVTAAKNSLTQAIESRKLKSEETSAATRDANQAVVDAREDLRKYIEIEGPTLIDDAEQDIITAQQDLLLAEAKLEFKLKVNADPELKSPFSKNDIEAEKLTVRKLKLAVKKAENALKMLEKYDHPRAIETYKRDVANAKLGLRRAQLEATSELLKSDATVAAAQATFTMQDRQLTEKLEDANKMVVKADKEGLVVYDTGRNRWYSSDVRVEVGAKISPRQQLMIIPDLSTLQIRTKVYEAMIDDVHPGLKAHVTFENKPDQSFSGKVIRVGVLPDSQNRWLNPGVKVFSVVVKLDEEIEGLRPGMTTEVEIELARLDNVLYVPIASVFSSGGKTFCYRVDNGEQKKVEVTLGRMNNTQVQILSGLRQGEKVLLAPPKGEHLDHNRDEAKDQEPSDEAPPAAGANGRGAPGKNATPRGTQPKARPSGQGGQKPRRTGRPAKAGRST